MQGHTSQQSTDLTGPQWLMQCFIDLSMTVDDFVEVFNDFEARNPRQTKRKLDRGEVVAEPQPIVARRVNQRWVEQMLAASSFRANLLRRLETCLTEWARDHAADIELPKAPLGRKGIDYATLRDRIPPQLRQALKTEEGRSQLVFEMLDAPDPKRLPLVIRQTIPLARGIREVFVYPRESGATTHSQALTMDMYRNHHIETLNRRFVVHLSFPTELPIRNDPTSYVDAEIARQIAFQLVVIAKDGTMGESTINALLGNVPNPEGKRRPFDKFVETVLETLDGAPVMQAAIDLKFRSLLPRRAAALTRMKRQLARSHPDAVGTNSTTSTAIETAALILHSMTDDTVVVPETPKLDMTALVPELRNEAAGEILDRSLTLIKILGLDKNLGERKMNGRFPSPPSDVPHELARRLNEQGFELAIVIDTSSEMRRSVLSSPHPTDSFFAAVASRLDEYRGIFRAEADRSEARRRQKSRDRKPTAFTDYWFVIDHTWKQIFAGKPRVTNVTPHSGETLADQVCVAVCHSEAQAELLRPTLVDFIERNEIFDPRASFQTNLEKLFESLSEVVERPTNRAAIATSV